MKKENLSLIFIGKRPSVVLILISTGSYIKAKKTGLIKSHLFQCFSLCLDFVKFHHKVNVLKSILYKNNYPPDFVGKCITDFLDRVLTREVV